MTHFQPHQALQGWRGPSLRSSLGHMSLERPECSQMSVVEKLTFKLWRFLSFLLFFWELSSNLISHGKVWSPQTCAPKQTYELPDLLTSYTTKISRLTLFILDVSEKKKAKHWKLLTFFTPGFSGTGAGYEALSGLFWWLHGSLWDFRNLTTHFSHFAAPHLGMNLVLIKETCL